MSPRTGRPRTGHTPNISLRINPDAYHAARIEAVTARKTVGQWIEEAINEKIEREKEVAAEARQAVYRSEDQGQVTSNQANPLSILAQLGSQGLPIDESHASLGMVYTNPPDNAAPDSAEEEPELLDGAYRVISESTTGQILNSPETDTNEPLSEEEIPEQFWPLLEAQGWKPPAKEVDEE